jgi:hypothetical protein
VVIFIDPSFVAGVIGGWSRGVLGKTAFADFLMDTLALPEL